MSCWLFAACGRKRLSKCCGRKTGWKWLLCFIYIYISAIVWLFIKCAEEKLRTVWTILSMIILGTIYVNVISDYVNGLAKYNGYCIVDKNIDDNIYCIMHFCPCFTSGLCHDINMIKRYLFIFNEKLAIVII